MAARVPTVRLSGFYFFYFSLLGAFLPYWPLYLQGLGLVPAQIGQIMAILAATKVVSPNLWGWLADHTGQTLRLIRWAAFFSLAGFGLMFRTLDFSGMVLAMLVFSFFWNATLPLFETITFGHLHRVEGRYSRIRLWGSIGFIATVAALGEALDGKFALSCLPQLILLLFCGLWINSLAVPRHSEAPHPDRAEPVAGILKGRGVLGLFLACLLLQVAHGPYYVFFSVYLRGHGYDSGETGQLWALGVLAEIIVFAWIPRLLGHVSLRGLFLGSLALSAGRWLLIAWGIDHLALLLSAQLLHAASFGATHAAAIHLVHRHFQGPHHGKGQALYSSMSFGLGGALGSFFSGQVWESWGPHWVYTAAAGTSLLAFVVAWPGVGRTQG